MHYGRLPDQTRTNCFWTRVLPGGPGVQLCAWGGKVCLRGGLGLHNFFQNTQESVAQSSRLSFKTTTRRSLPLAGASSLFDVIGIFLKNLRFWRPQRRISGNLFRVTGCSNAPCCPVLKLREQGPGLFNKLGAKPIEKRLTLWGGFITRPQLKS